MRRFSSLLLISSILFATVFCGLLTGCSSKKVQPRDKEYVEDSVWFDNTIYETRFYEGANGSSGFKNGPVIYASDTELIMFEWISTNNDEEANLIYYKLGEDGSCTIEGVVDLFENDLMSRTDHGAPIDDESKYICDISMVGDLVYCWVKGYFIDEEGLYRDFGYIQVVDVKNSCLGERISNENIDNFMSSSDLFLTWSTDDRIYSINNNSNDIFKFDYSIVEYTTEFEEVGSTPISGLDDGSYLSNEFLIDDSTLIIITRRQNDFAGAAYVVDLETCEATLVEDFPDEIIADDWDWRNVNGRILSSDIYGIREYDYETNTVNEVFNYNNCNVVRSETPGFDIVYIDADTILTCYLKWDEGLNYKLWKFERAESNPNAGEVIIRVADLDDRISEKVSEAIYKFNEESDSAFAILDDRYMVGDYLIDVNESKVNEWDYQQTDEYKTALRNAQSTLSNQLRVDIISGNGPDIVLDAYGHSEFNNSEILVDLRSELIDGGYVNPDEYLPCVFGYADEIYQVPLWVAPRGVLWRAEPGEMFTDSYGLTYDEYQTLVGENCNGKDPMSFFASRTDYFLELFNNSFSTFIHDGTIDIDNDEFRALAEFASSRNERRTYNPNEYYNYKDAYYGGSVLGENDIHTMTLNHYVPSALPSLDGQQGFRFHVASSVAVVSTCPMMDEAMMLIKDIVEGYALNIRIDDIYTRELARITETNEDIENRPDAYVNPAMARLNGNEADIYIEVLTSSSELVYEDADINVILYEEIQAYFAGDKTLDEVIPIIEDRAQTVLNERG